MKPLELSSIGGIWKSALVVLTRSLEQAGPAPQVWFPWGAAWRGQDASGTLPPTNFPPELVNPKASHFGGRNWRGVHAAGFTWLISLKAGEARLPDFDAWKPCAESVRILEILGEFIRLECLLGLTMKILENRASEHAGHWDRVRNLCVAIGRRMGLSDRELVDLELAGMLHDIGKVALPSAILEETRPLSAAERKQIESHSMIGASMIREIPGLDRVSECVLHHHEAPDGSGYPKGIRSPDIPLNSLIIGAADAFDAMTHYRPYASERTYKESMEELVKHSGKYDDRVLWALQEVLKNLGILDTRPISPPQVLEDTN